MRNSICVSKAVDSGEKCISISKIKDHIQYVRFYKPDLKYNIIPSNFTILSWLITKNVFYHKFLLKAFNKTNIMIYSPYTY